MMKCPKCNYPVSEGSHFCGGCGAKINTVTLCHNCGAPLEGGVIFCPSCGSPVKGADTAGKPYVESNSAETAHISGKPGMTDDLTSGNTMKLSKIPGSASDRDKEENLEKTMTIPVVKPAAYKSAAADVSSAVRRSAPSSDNRPVQRPQPARQQPKQTVHQGQRAGVYQPKRAARPQTGNVSKGNYAEKQSGSTRKNVLIFLAVFLLVLLAGVGAMFAYMGINDRSNSEEPSAQTGTHQSGGANQASGQDAGNAEVPEPEEPAAEEEPERDSGSSLGSTVPYEPLIDLGYSFGSKAENGEAGQDSIAFEYTGHTESDYFLEYKIPAEFALKSIGGAETRYTAEDNTAYVDIGYMANSENWSLRDVIDSTIDRLGGVESHEITANDRFTVTTEANGVFYYQKCYVTGDYVRYFEVAFPSVYSDIYSDLVSGIDAGFKCKE